MNHRSEKIAEYAQHLDSQIDGLQHTLSVRTGELAIARMNNLALQTRIEELELAASDTGVERES
jgi:hypothetical protein